MIDHQNIAIPGSVDTVDLRAQDPHGAFGVPMLRLVAGRYPTGPGEVAVTTGWRTTLRPAHRRTAWQAAGTVRRVVGLVENPHDLHDEFALVAPGQADPPSSVTILFDTSDASVEAFHLPERRTDDH